MSLRPARDSQKFFLQTNKKKQELMQNSWKLTNRQYTCKTWTQASQERVACITSKTGVFLCTQIISRATVKAEIQNNNLNIYLVCVYMCVCVCVHMCVYIPYNAHGCCGLSICSSYSSSLLLESCYFLYTCFIDFKPSKRGKRREGDGGEHQK